MVSVSLSPLHASPQDQSVCNLQNDLVGFAICSGESHAYVVRKFRVAMDRFLGIEMVGISYFNPVRLMWCLPYQSVSLMCKMLLAHDLVGLTISRGEIYVYVVFMKLLVRFGFGLRTSYILFRAL